MEKGMKAAAVMALKSGLEKRNPAEEGMRAARKDNFKVDLARDVRAFFRIRDMIYEHLDATVHDMCGNAVELEIWKAKGFDRKWFTVEELAEELSEIIFNRGEK